MLKFFIEKNIQSGIKDNKREHHFLNFSRIKNVLIFFDFNKWDEILPIISDLEDNSKKVIAWTILPKEMKVDSTTNYPESVKIIDLNKSLNWMKVFRTDIFDEFNNLKYDTLLDLCMSRDEYLLSLLVRNHAQFYIGINEDSNKLYDFIIYHEEDKSLFDTYEQLKNYLPHIQ